MLTAALRQLPITHRTALALHYLLDLSVDDVAIETGAPVGTVKSWLSRGRAGLAVVLEEMAGDRSPHLDRLEANHVD
jgi:RNA polymerase sigma-70 factor (ECF subfamily)